MSKRWMYSCAALTAAIALGLPAQPFAQQTKAPQTKSAAKKGTAAARTIEIQGLDTLKFQPATLRAKPGETLKIVLKVDSMMPKAVMSHNFVLLTLTADVNEFVQAASRARTTDYIPAAKKGDMLAHTAMIGEKGEVEVTFTAPTTPGTYTFVCTFPAHYQGGMKGSLIVG